MPARSWPVIVVALSLAGAAACSPHRDRPTSGTYQGVDGMGLFWSMNPPDGDPEQALHVPPAAGSFTVDLSVAAGGRQLATRTLTRQRRRDGVTVRALRMDTDQVAGLLAFLARL